MTPRRITRTDIPLAVSSLLAGRNLVVLTDVTGDTQWAAYTAWDFARATARTGTRVALVDLSLDAPVLHTGVQDPPESGIVDAFLFGASLEHVSNKQDVPGLHFIGVGTPPSDSAKVWGSPRWERLVKGFASQGAVLLLYVPASGLAHLAVTPDLIVVLSPRDKPAEDRETKVRLLASEHGIPAVRIVPGPTPGAKWRFGSTRTVLTGVPYQEEEARRPLFTTHDGADLTEEARSTRRRDIVLGSVAVVSTALVASVILLLSNRQVSDPDDRSQPTDSPADSSPAAAAATTRGAPVPRASAAVPSDSAAVHPESLSSAAITPAVLEGNGDSLYYSVQVAAFSRLEDALEHARELYRAGFPATMTAVPREPESIWYRVLVGAHGTVRDAAVVRSAMQSNGILEPTTGVVLRTPYALRIAIRPDRAAAVETAEGLRESGVPAYIVEMPDRSVHVLTGAFESPDQARLTESVFAFARLGLSLILVPRVGKEQ
jgi:cell division septation protein DedD